MKKVLLIIIVVLITGCKNKEIVNDELTNLLIDIKETIPVFSNVTFNDIIVGINMEGITFDDTPIKTDKIGINENTINYEYQGKKYKYDYTINIIDETSPFIFGSTSLTKIKNSKIDLCATISYGDNYDSKPQCEIKGNYDTSQTGTYNLKILVKDQSNNQTEKNVKLKIVDKINSSSSNTNNKLEFNTVKERYKNEQVEYGIDVSSWQEEIDFKTVKEAGISFVMIRIGFQSSDGVKMDSYYEQNIKKAKEAGLKVGIYLYSNAKSADDINYQVTWILEKIKDVSLDLPIAFDWEDWSKYNKYQLSFYELNMLANLFIEQINATNKYQGCLYGSKYYLEQIWHEAKKHPIWLAHYTTKTNYQDNYFMWQFSNVGRIPGISGNVDLNLLYNS